MGTYDKWAGEYGMYVSMLNGVWNSFGLGFSSVLHQSRPVGWGPNDYLNATNKARAILKSPVARVIGNTFNVVGLVDAAYDTYKDPGNVKNWVRVVGNGAMFVGSATNPWLVGAKLGYGIIETIYLDD